MEVLFQDMNKILFPQICLNPNTLECTMCQFPKLTKNPCVGVGLYRLK